MKSDKLLKIGLIGSVVIAICCFTPALVWLFALLGLSALIGYLDLVLLPALTIFIVILLAGVWFKLNRS